MINCYISPDKRKAAKIARVFATGSNGRLMNIGEDYQFGPAFFYGMTSYTFGIRESCIASGYDWYYADNAYYFGRGTHFRVTRNAWQTDGRGAAGPKRFREFGLKVQPWHRAGEYILIATQSDLFYRMFEGIGREEWVKRVIVELRKHTDRQVQVAVKPEPTAPEFPHAPFEALVDDAWAVVTHSSSCAVGAILHGVPVFTTASCCADPVSSGPLSNIEHPHYPDDRDQWLWNLAASQWTRREMRRGQCWRELQEMACESP